MPSLGLRDKYGKDHGAELRESRRAFSREQAATLAESRLAEEKRKQVGETRRKRMQIEADRESSVGRTSAKKTTSKKGLGLTATQMAKHRESALSTSKKQLENMRDFEGKVINPATGKIMTAAQENDFVRFEADNLLQYTLGDGKVSVEEPEPEPEGRGWVETAGGRRFEVAGGKVMETTPATPIPTMPPLPPQEPDVSAKPATTSIPPVPAPADRRATTAMVAPSVTRESMGAGIKRLREQYEAEQQEAMPHPARTLGRWGSSMLGAGKKYLRENVSSRKSYTPEQRERMNRTRMKTTFGIKGF